MLVKRDSFNLAASLEGLLGSKAYSHYIFGIGVVGMALSTIIILMTINGHAVCEVLGKPHQGPPFSWEHSLQESEFWAHSFGAMQLFGSRCLHPLSGFTLIPLAYLSFFLLINNKRVLGRERPEGKARWLWNVSDDRLGCYGVGRLLCRLEQNLGRHSVRPLRPNCLWHSFGDRGLFAKKPQTFQEGRRNGNEA